MTKLQFAGLSDQQLLNAITDSAAEARRCDIQIRHYDAIAETLRLTSLSALRSRRTFSANKVLRLEAQADTRYEITRLPRAIQHAIDTGNSRGENVVADQLVAAGLAANYLEALDLIYAGDNA